MPTDRLAHVRQYRNDLREANTEAAKKERFKSLLERLFGHDDQARDLIDQMSLGAERLVLEIPLRERIKTGFADTQYGNVIIECEADLGKTGEHARDQLREYYAGNHEAGATRRFMLIATDGRRWEVFSARHSARQSLTADQVELKSTETFTLTKETAGAFFFFLDRHLFRTERLKPTLERVQREFGPSSAVFAACMNRLTAHFETIRDDGEVQTAYDQWQRFLSIAYGSFEGDPQAFLVHTYLSVFAKMLAYVVITQAEHINEDKLRGILRGDIFDELNVRNFIDRDFFGWIGREEHLQPLLPVFRQLTQAIGNYDFTRVDEDILKGVYQELIDRDTRHGLGEYYTPDWLCERVVRELDLEKDSRTLDPACGSGSFLRAAVMDLRERHPNLSADEIAQRVTGIDIHPLSVQIAKTTMLLALGEKIKAEQQPVTLRIYLANTLLAPEGSIGLFGSDFTMTIDGKPYKISSKVFDDPGFFDAATNVCENLADATKGGDAVDRDGFRRALQARDLGNGLSDDLVQNSYKPYFMQEQFDYVIGNPPWISYRYIENEEYQDQLRRLAEKERVMPEKQANFTHLEIAAIFLAHASRYFMKKRAQLAFVLPRSFFSAEHHDKTRSGAIKAFKINEVWDLEDVEPLFKVPSCVLFGERRHARKKIPKKGVPGYAVRGRLPEANVNWEEAKSLLDFEQARFYYGQLGNLSALTRSRLQRAGRVNHYKSRFKQGATIVPRNFYFVKVTSDPPNLKDRVVTVRPDDEQLKYAKPPWKHFEARNFVHTQFLFRTALAKNLLPFAMVNPPLVLLPATADAEHLKVLSPRDLLERGRLDTAEWFRKTAGFWQENRTERSASMTLIDRLNYHQGVTAQDLTKEYLVLYTASAKDANAAVVERAALDRDFVVECAAYWYGTDDAEEAHYVASFLNADMPNRTIKEFQARGNFGPRHVHKKILELALPAYDASDERHARLAGLGAEAQSKTAAFLDGRDLDALSGRDLGALRLDVRAHLEDELAAMDAALAALAE